MNYRTRVRLATGTAALLLVALNPPAAFADTSQPSIIGTRLSSDPHIDVCHVKENGVDKPYWCMYTSNDLPVHDDSNFYPMDSTYVYTFDPASGLNPGDPANWVDRAGHRPNGDVVPAFSESQLPFAAPGKHLWAPTRAAGLHPGETLLYVPDAYGGFTVPGISENEHPAYIAVGTSYRDESNSTPASNGAPWGHFNYWKTITYKGADLQLTYMSDPAVVTLADTHPVIDNAYVDEHGNVVYPDDYHPTGGPATWLLWANGDYNHGGPRCGSLGIGRLSDNDLTDLVDDPRLSIGPTGPIPVGPSDIQVLGIGPALGTCRDTGHPYIEGPELYDLAQLADSAHPGGVALPNGNERYLLMFAAKPETTYDNGATTLPSARDIPGKSQLSVLAYATSANPRGPYTYRGLLMDSSSTSWTNHGSILFDHVEVNGQSQTRMILFYHDETPNAGPHGNDGWHERKSRAACLSWDLSAKAFVEVVRPTAIPDLNACQGLVP